MDDAPVRPGPVSWTPADAPSQQGRTAVVTGATSGLGLVVAGELAAHGAHVVMGVRDLGRAEHVRADLERSARATGSGGSLEARELDLLDLDSVHRFAAGLADLPALDLLVNDAGVGGGAHALSPQGYERVWATNVLGPFALTGLLVPLLSRGSAPRVVTVASNAYKRIRVELPLDDPAGATGWSAGRAYVASKLADLLLGVELDRRLRVAGSPLRSLVAHPGVADTPLQRSGASRRERALGRLLALALGRSAAAGAIPLLYAATAPDAPTGLFLGPSLRKHDVRVHAAPLVAPADDLDLARRLWSTVEHLTGVVPDLTHP